MIWFSHFVQMYLTILSLCMRNVYFINSFMAIKNPKTCKFHCLPNSFLHFFLKFYIDFFWLLTLYTQNLYLFENV